MTDKDTQLLQEAMNNMYGSKGKYKIQVQVLDENGIRVPDWEVINHEVSGDEAAWQLYQDIQSMLTAEPDEDGLPETYPSASDPMA